MKPHSVVATLLATSCFALRLPLQFDKGPFLGPQRDVIGDLKSLIPTNFINNVAKDDDVQDLIIIPSSLFTSEVFSNLNLKIKDHFTFSLDAGEDKPQRHFPLPQDVKNLFLFNSTKVLKLPTEIPEISRFLKSSPPFELPSFVNLVDYYLVVPIGYYQKGPSNRTLFGGPSAQNYVLTSSASLPIFRSAISEQKPLLVSVFNIENPKEIMKNKNPIVYLKDYLTLGNTLNSIPTFFDRFANEWTTSMGLENFVQSSFCSTNSGDLLNSYCLKISDKKSIQWLPAFFDVNELWNQKIFKREDPVFETQVLRQFKNKLSKTAALFNDVTWDLAYDPKPLVSRVDNKIDTIAKDMKDQLNSYPEAAFSKADHLAEMFKEKEQEIKQGVHSKVSHIRKYKFEPQLLVKDDFYDEYDTSYVPNGKYSYDGDYETGYVGTDDENSDTEFDSDCEDNEKDRDDEDNARKYAKREEYATELGLKIPLALLAMDDPYFASPRSAQYTQVYVHDKLKRRMAIKRESLFSDDSNCEKITWFNIFHHSIFGKPKFCLNETRV